MSKRINYLDALKGLAIILVVIGHIADGYLNANSFESHNLILFNIYNFIYSFHMPLFILISGFIFSQAYFKNKEIKKEKIIRQILNLVYLYLVFSILQWIFKYFLSDFVNTKVGIKDLYLLVIKPMAPYWYLYNLVCYYLVTYFLYKIIKNKYLKIGVLIVFFSLSILFFKISIIYFFVFFSIGFYINQINNEKSSNIYYGGFIISLILYFIFYDYQLYYNQMPIIGTIIALIVSLSVFELFKKKNISNSFLEYIGRNSLEIYLIHCYFTAFNRIVLIKIGITNFYINFIVNLIISIVICLFISQITKKLGIHNYIFMPFKDKKVKSEK